MEKILILLTIMAFYLQVKNPGAFAPGLFFVAESNEISNLDFLRDLDKIIILNEVLTMKE